MIHMTFELIEIIRETYGLTPLIWLGRDYVVFVLVGPTEYEFSDFHCALEYFRAERLAFQCPKMIKFLLEAV